MIKFYAIAAALLFSFNAMATPQKDAHYTYKTIPHSTDIMRISDRAGDGVALLPADPKNDDFAAYTEWVKQGNTAEIYVPPPPPPVKIKTIDCANEATMDPRCAAWIQWQESMDRNKNAAPAQPIKLQGDAQ